MTFDEIKDLDNSELLELYEGVVKVNHYDPCETPQFIIDMRKQGISQYDIRRLIIMRMEQ